MGPQSYIRCVVPSILDGDVTDNKALSGAVVIFGLIWSVLLSVYLSKAWSHSTTLQRRSLLVRIDFPLTRIIGAIILAIICVNGFSSLLLYLM